MQYLNQTYRQVHTKMQQACYKNKLTLGEIELYTNTNSNGYFSVIA